MLTKSVKEEEEDLFASSLHPTVRGAITATFYVTVHFYVGCPRASSQNQRRALASGKPGQAEFVGAFAVKKTHFASCLCGTKAGNGNDKLTGSFSCLQRSPRCSRAVAMPIFFLQRRLGWKEYRQQWVSSLKPDKIALRALISSMQLECSCNHRSKLDVKTEVWDCWALGLLKSVPVMSFALLQPPGMEGTAAPPQAEHYWHWDRNRRKKSR